jgi:hypothetical protein
VEHHSGTLALALTPTLRSRAVRQTTASSVSTGRTELATPLRLFCSARATRPSPAAVVLRRKSTTPSSRRDNSSASPTRDSHVQVACLPTPRRCASAASAASAAEAVATSRTAGLDDDQSSRRRGPRPLHRRGRGPCESWCSSKSVSRCSSAAFRGKAPAAAERPVHAHVRADDREQPARTRIACRGRSVGATGQRPLRGAVAISKAGVRGPDAGRLVRHDLDHANVPMLATARVVAARARLGRRRSGASPRAGGVSCRSVDRQADGDVEARSRRGRNCSARSAAQPEACVDASFLTARQFRRILREPRRDPRPAAWKATLAAARGEHRRFQRRVPRD